MTPVPEQIAAGGRLYQPFTDALHHLYAGYSDQELAVIADYHRKMGEIFAWQIASLRDP